MRFDLFVSTFRFLIFHPLLLLIIDWSCQLTMESSWWLLPTQHSQKSKHHSHHFCLVQSFHYFVILVAAFVRVRIRLHFQYMHLLSCTAAIFCSFRKLIRQILKIRNFLFINLIKQTFSRQLTNSFLNLGLVMSGFLFTTSQLSSFVHLVSRSVPLGQSPSSLHCWAGQTIVIFCITSRSHISVCVEHILFIKHYSSVSVASNCCCSQLTILFT